MTKRKYRAALLAPRVWHSTWGQEKDLVQRLVADFKVDVLDLVDFSHRHHKAGLHHFPPPEEARVIERATPPTLPLQGLYLELANFFRILFGHYELMITYLTMGAVLASLAARLRRVKILLIYADDYIEFYRAKSGIIGWLTAKAANPVVAGLADRASATARLLAEDIRPYNHRVVHLPNGTDAAKLAKVPAKIGGRFTVGFVGGFGHWVDFEAVTEAARLCPEIDFRLVGGGDRFEEVKSLAGGLDNVSLTGQVDYDRVQVELAAMDACLIPFKVNRLTDRVSPIKLFEYWAAGRPVVASHTREVAETAEHEAALYYWDGQGASLAEAIKRLRDEKGLAAELRQAGRRRLADYDWDRIYARYRLLLEEMGFETGGP